MEGKKISFGFLKTKKQDKPALTETKEYIDCLEEKSIKVVGGEVVKEIKPLVIPMKANTLITAERLQAIAVKVENFDEPVVVKQEKEEEPPNNESLDQMAVRELMEGAKKIKVEVKEELVVPVNVKLEIEVQAEATLDDYEAVPVQDFGLAMLRGMGWTESKEHKSTKVSTTKVEDIRSQKIKKIVSKTNAQKCKEYREKKRLRNKRVQNTNRSDECNEEDKLQILKKPKTGKERSKAYYDRQKLKKPQIKKTPKTAAQRSKEYRERKKLKQNDLLQKQNTDHLPISIYKQPQLRPKGLGLGADKVVKENQKKKSGKDEEELSIVKNSFVKITSGKYSGFYGKVVSLDEDNGRVMVDIVMKKETVSLSEFMMQPVTKSEFDKQSKVINSESYEKYKKNEKLEYVQHNSTKTGERRETNEGSSSKRPSDNREHAQSDYRTEQRREEKRRNDIEYSNGRNRKSRSRETEDKSKDRYRRESSSSEEDRSRHRKKNKKKYSSNESLSSASDKEKESVSRRRRSSDSSESNYRKKDISKNKVKRDIDKKRKGKKKKRDRDRSPNYKKHRK